MTTENKAKHFAHFILSAKSLFSGKTTASERAHGIFEQRLKEIQNMEQKDNPHMGDMY